MIRVLIVDDSVIYRKVIREVLAGMDDVEVVATASDGTLALQRLEQMAVDVVTLDLQMPGMDGLAVLRELKRRDANVEAIMLSAHTKEGAKQTLEALELGAIDFITKPIGTDLQENARLLRDQLERKLREVAQHRLTSAARPCSIESNTATTAEHKTLTCPSQGGSSASSDLASPPRAMLRPKLLAIGISTGGPAALKQLIPKLPACFPVPIVIVQHMPPLFTASLAEDLDRVSRLEVGEAKPMELIRPGQVRIAPGGKQLKVAKVFDFAKMIVTDDPPVDSCRPSFDYLLESVAAEYSGASLVAVMTGMGVDGTRGCQQLKQEGARVLAQDEASCTVFGMPRSVIAAGLADQVCALPELADTLTNYVKSGAVRR